MSLASQPFIKPPALCPGDVCIVVSPSWGGPALFPRVRDELGLIVREAEHAPAASVAERAADLHAAFADREARLIVTSIGGDDTLLLLVTDQRDLREPPLHRASSPARASRGVVRCPSHESDRLLRGATRAVTSSDWQRTR